MVLFCHNLAFCFVDKLSGLNFFFKFMKDCRCTRLQSHNLSMTFSASECISNVVIVLIKAIIDQVRNTETVVTLNVSKVVLQSELPLSCIMLHRALSFFYSCYESPNVYDN